MAEVTSRLPSSIFLISYSYNKESVQIKAASTDEVAIAQFMVNLENSEAFEKISLTNVDTSQAEGVLTFSLRIIPKKGT